MMKIGFIGLGRMGKAMVLHLLEKGVDVVVYNRTVAKVGELVKEVQSAKLRVQSEGKIGNLIAAYSVEELVKNLEAPRVVWLMVPQGGPVGEMIEQLVEVSRSQSELVGVSRSWSESVGVSRSQSELVLAKGVVGNKAGVARGNHPKGGKLEAGDTIIDGGNCFFKDSQKNYQLLKEKGINYIDVGTSGGLAGARNGACLMIGGDEEVYKKLEPLFEKLAVKDGYAYFGPAGAGHFVKMIHNGVEYGMLQSLGEGFEILEKGMPTSLAGAALARLDLGKVARNWSHGSVVRGWLTELLERALGEDPGLVGIEGVIGGGTTGRWVEEVGKKLKVETPVISASLRAREKSQTKPTFAGKVVAALRNQFGGHEVKRK